MNYFSLQEAAERLNVSISFVQQLIRDRELSWVPILGIPQPSLLDYEARSHQRSQEALDELVKLSESMGLYNKEPQ